MANILETVSMAINLGGFLCEYANPYRWVPEIQEPVVALSLEDVDSEKNQVILRAEVVSPVALGGEKCYESALKLVVLLQDIGGKCSIRGCEFDPKTELFSMAVLVAFYGDPMDESWVAETGCQVVWGGDLVGKPLSFSAWRESREETALAASVWQFRMEEILDSEFSEAEAYDPFTIQVSAGGFLEQYTGCTLTSQQRIFEDGRVRQIRQGTATGKE